MAAVTPTDLAGFSYTEHAENLALALAVCAELGIDRQTALGGMWRAAPDPARCVIGTFRPTASGSGWSMDLRPTIRNRARRFGI